MVIFLLCTHLDTEVSITYISTKYSFSNCSLRPSTELQYLYSYKAFILSRSAHPYYRIVYAKCGARSLGSLLPRHLWLKPRQPGTQPTSFGRDEVLRQRYPAAYSIRTLPKVRALVASALSPEQPARIYKASWARDTSACYFAHLLFLLFLIFFLVLFLTFLTFFVALGIFLPILGYEPGQIYHLDGYNS